jgi:hypothetical protein
MLLVSPQPSLKVIALQQPRQRTRRPTEQHSVQINADYTLVVVISICTPAFIVSFIHSKKADTRNRLPNFIFVPSPFAITPPSESSR